MSADVPTVVLTGPAMVPLVRAAAALEAEDIPPFAVIGGVAVTVRLGRVMRATADLDAVTDQRYTPTALEILCSRDDTAYDATDPHTITISGAEVQFQDVEPVGDRLSHGLADPLHQLGELLLAAGTERDRVAGRGQGHRRGGPDARGRAGDHRGPTVGAGVLLAAHQRGPSLRRPTVIGRCA